MRESIEKIVRKAFPELNGKLHLDRFARVVAISDAPEHGSSAERFRPRYAVDLEILTPEGELDPDFPTYEAVPLPVANGCGMESGLFGFPEPGCVAVVGFAYGRVDCPIVRQIYPLGMSLPKLQPKQQRWQQSAAVFQDMDADGNWRRHTDAGIEDESTYRVARALENVDEFSREMRQISEDSIEEVGGLKLVEALGALKLLSGGVLNLAAVDNLNLTSGADIRSTAGRDRLDVVGRDLRAEIMRDMIELVKGNVDVTAQGNRSETTGGDKTENVASTSKEEVGEAKEIQAKHVTLLANTFSFGQSGPGGVSMLPVLLEFMDEVRCALRDLADHTHPTIGVVCVDTTEIGTHSDEVARLRGLLAGLVG